MKIVYPHLMGIQTTHSIDFLIDRADDPYGTCLILCFRSPALVLTESGMETAGLGDCIIHSVDFRQYHCSVPGANRGYSNDWIHVAPMVLEPMMNRWQLPFNQLIATGHPEVLTPFIRLIQDELISPDEFTDPIVACQLENMILAVARSRRTMIRQGSDLTNTERRYYPCFSELRQRILRCCVDEVKIGELAEEVNLSTERFAVLYRKFFYASPYAEVMEARLVKAKQLLLGTSMEIKEIADACGWENLHYFSRMFKVKTGMPPSHYREQRQSGGTNPQPTS